MKSVVVMVVAFAFVAAACGSTGATGTPAGPGSAAASATDTPTDAPTDSAATSDEPSGPIVPDSPVAGIVVAVDSAGLNQVKGFTLRTNDGETIDFTLGPLENATDFPPGHLTEHQTTAAPILVFFKVDSGQLVVFRIEDAG